MNNDSKSISANEINKFLYCPYQWYYERYYGAAHIRRLYKERNKKLGLEDRALSNFKSGLDFHAAYDGGPRAGMGIFAKLLIGLAAIAGIACGIWVYLYA